MAASFDLEECVSLIDSQIEDARTKPLRRVLQQIRWLLLSLLGETLVDFRPDPWSKRPDAFSYLCSLLRSGPIITFNYDCLVEDYLDQQLPLDPMPPMPLADASPEIIQWFRSTFGETSEGAISWNWEHYHRLARYLIRFDEVLVEPAGSQREIMPGQVCYRNLLPIKYQPSRRRATCWSSSASR